MGATVSLSGIVKWGSDGKRKFNIPHLSVKNEADIKIVVPAPDNPFCGFMFGLQQKSENDGYERDKDENEMAPTQKHCWPKKEKEGNPCQGRHQHARYPHENRTAFISFVLVQHRCCS